MATKTTQENKYKVTCRTKGTITFRDITISAPNKDAAYFRAIDELEKQGIKHQTVIESIVKNRN